MNLQEERLHIINQFISEQLIILAKEKKTRFNNKWAIEFDVFYEKTRIGLIQVIENYLLQPTRNIQSGILVFKSKQEPVRKEINHIVNKEFFRFRILNFPSIKN